VFGRFFTSYAQVTRPFARTSDGRAIVADPLIVESVAVTHNNAGSYEIAIDPDYSVESLATRTMVAPFAPETFGFLTCRAGMIADVATIVVRTPALSPHPLGVSQIRFDGQYSPTGIVSTR
jgi:hypothetical protein